MFRLHLLEKNALDITHPGDISCKIKRSHVCLHACLLEVHDQHIMCNVFTMYIIIYNYCILAHLLAVLVLMPAALANRQMTFHIFVTGRQEQSILPTIIGMQVCLDHIFLKKCSCY